MTKQIENHVTTELITTRNVHYRFVQGASVNLSPPNRHFMRSINNQSSTLSNVYPKFNTTYRKYGRFFPSLLSFNQNDDKCKFRQKISFKCDAPSILAIKIAWRENQ